VIRDVDGRFTGELPERPKPTSSVRDLVALALKQNGVGGDPQLRRGVAAWREAAGAEFCEQARVTGLKKGVLTVEVDSAALLQELSVYRRKELLLVLRQKEPSISEVKFKPGSKGRAKGRTA
jgi:predicted nucleic acid-binding Zn ribbon protein